MGTHGIITTTRAHEIGVSDKELSRLVSSGRLERVGYCTYRVRHHVPTRLDQFDVAAAVVGDGAFVYGPSVLALLGLAPADPRRVHVATTRRVRHRLPPFVVLHRVGGSDTTTSYEGIPVQEITGALLASKGLMMDERIADATREALRRGLVFEEELEAIGLDGGV